MKKPISILLPNQLTCVIETTDAALKGQTVSSSYKPATLDNGLNIAAATPGLSLTPIRETFESF